MCRRRRRKDTEAEGDGGVRIRRREETEAENATDFWTAVKVCCDEVGSVFEWGE